MRVEAATALDVEPALRCWVEAFADDPITRYLLQPGPGYGERLHRFFSLLMRARMALAMPVTVARGESGIQGAAMGYSTVRPPWPIDIAAEWDRFESEVVGLTQRMADYDEIADAGKPATPHYYLGVIGIEPALWGSGLGRRLLRSFCDLSARDRLSSGVYLETASPSNVRFYQRAGFAEVGRGRLGDATLWCMYLAHPSR